MKFKEGDNVILSNIDKLPTERKDLIGLQFKIVAVDDYYHHTKGYQPGYGMLLIERQEHPYSFWVFEKNIKHSRLTKLKRILDYEI